MPDVLTGPLVRRCASCNDPLPCVCRAAGRVATVPQDNPAPALARSRFFAVSQQVVCKDTSSGDQFVAANCINTIASTGVAMARRIAAALNLTADAAVAAMEEEWRAMQAEGPLGPCEMCGAADREPCRPDCPFPVPAATKGGLS